MVVVGTNELTWRTPNHSAEHGRQGPLCSCAFLYIPCFEFSVLLGALVEKTASGEEAVSKYQHRSQPASLSPHLGGADSSYLPLCLILGHLVELLDSIRVPVVFSQNQADLFYWSFAVVSNGTCCQYPNLASYKRC